MSRGEAAIIAPEMAQIVRGGMRARLAASMADHDAVMALRARAWPGDAADPLDAVAAHLMIEGRDGALLATMRVLLSARAAQDSYSARFYDLSALAAAGMGARKGAGKEGGRIMLEPGRFSASPAAGWEALRLTWAALARITLTSGAECLFGCASFPGADWQRHRAALALLAQDHTGERRLLPERRAAEVVEHPDLAGPVTDRKAALAGLPPLLRFYLGLGGWVSDHAVVDRQLDTLHVFTCVELARMPEARREALRALASD